MTKLLLIGTIDAEGCVDPRPVVADTDADGRVNAWRYLDGYEPASTLSTRSLLHLPTLTIVHHNA